jgi:uncharacterized protein YndB with AHSA1/START domain
MQTTELVYVNYIRTTPEKLWAAITNPEFARQYWGGHENHSDWKEGSEWKHVSDDEGRPVRVVGKVVESIPPKRLVLSWADPSDTEDVSRVTFEIEPVADMVRLNVIHGDFQPGSIMSGKVSGGWPLVLASLKTYLETGKGLDIWGAKGHCSDAKA